ncbi:cytochrome P450 [Cyathus striatus]|nr:cytochrome P450 [Cyathus striatus]
MFRRGRGSWGMVVTLVVTIIFSPHSFSELISDIFSMLLAGHESTATAPSATIAYLATYPDLQQEICEQIHFVLGSDSDPTFNDYAELNKVQTCFYERLRLFH